MPKIYEIKQSVFADNDRRADLLRQDLRKEGTFLLNLMSAPGSGKTTTLTKTLSLLKDELRIGVMEADIDSDVDACTIEKTGVKVVQLHTGGMCHLEGDDKPLKYPLMFTICDVLLINKTDVLPYFDFDLDKCRERALALNPDMTIIPISAKTGEGIEEWAGWLLDRVREWRKDLDGAEGAKG